MWMSASKLAQKMGKSVRYVQKLAAEGRIRWTMKDGKSKLYDSDSVPLEKAPNLDSSRALTPVSASNSSLSSFQALGGKVTEKEKQKFSVLQKLRNIPAGTTKAQWYGSVAFFFGISEATVRRYEKEFEKTGLITSAPKESSNRSFDPEAIEWVKGYMLKSLQQTGFCTKQSAWEHLVDKAHEMGWQIGSRSTAYNLLGTIDTQLLEFSTGGNRSLDNYFYIRRDCTKLRPMQIIIGDQHIFDYWVADYTTGVMFRPECYCWIDMCTKMVYGVALETHAYTSETVKESLRNGILRHGLFENTYNDNGKPECSKATNEVIEDLMHAGAGMNDICELDKTKAGRYAVECEDGSVVDAGPTPASYRRIFAQVKNAKAKDIERFFRTIEEMLKKMNLPGHAATPGASAAQDEVERARLERDKDRHFLLDIFEFAQALSECFEKYEMTVHGTLGMTPRDYLAKRKDLGWKENRSLSALAVDCIMMARTKRKVRNGFVSIDGRFYKGPLLTSTAGKIDDTGVWNHEGETVDVRFSPWDPSYIVVRVKDSTEPWRPLLLEDMSNVMLDDIALKEKMAQKRQQMKAVREAFKVATAMIGDVVYRPDRKPDIEEQEAIIKALPEPKTIPFRPEYFAHGFERYAWCLEMVLTGNMEYLTDEDKAFIQSYRSEPEYQENAQRWELLEAEIKTRGIMA
jgi:putative transposase